jgi:hypothetical protein
MPQVENMYVNYLVVASTATGDWGSHTRTGTGVAGSLEVSFAWHWY